jgi:hypothetical protein
MAPGAPALRELPLLSARPESKTGRERHHLAFAALGLMHVELRLLEVHVLHPQVQRLGHSQPAAVKQVNDQSCRVAMNVRDSGEQAAHLLLGGTVPGICWPLGA